MWCADHVTSHDIVIVHGLYHQPAHFRPLASALHQRGLTVHIPRLYRGSLDRDTHEVQTVVNQCHTTPVVVGHSYGGAVITGLTGISALVYIAAFIPDTTESCASLGGPDAPINRYVQPQADGRTYIPATYATTAFYADCPQETARWATALLLPQEPGHGRGIPTRAAWKSTPSIDIVCSDDHAMEPDLQRRLARRCDQTIELASSHSPYLSRPTEVTGIIESASLVQ